jgi:hypothetical protein
MKSNGSNTMCVVPSRYGTNFGAKWSGKTLAEVYDAFSLAMPPANPGSLSPATYASIVAYFLRRSAHPQGQQELPADPAVRQLRRLRRERAVAAGRGGPLVYPSSRGFSPGRDWRNGGSWTVDYSRGDRKLPQMLRRFTRTDVRTVEQPVDAAGEGDTFYWRGEEAAPTTLLGARAPPQTSPFSFRSWPSCSPLFRVSSGRVSEWELHRDVGCEAALGRDSPGGFVTIQSSV